MTDDPLDQVLRCVKFSCLLTHRACLRRQTETKRVASNHKSRPVYEFCASGDCVQGNEVAAKHPEFEVVRQDNTKPPRLDIIRAVEEGVEMPKGYRRGQACKTCGSRGTKHVTGCKEAAAAPVARTKPTGRVEKIRAAAAKVKAPRQVAAAAEEPVGISERVERMSLDELLVWKGLIEGQLAAREQVLVEQLAEVRKAIRASKGAAAEAA